MVAAVPSFTTPPAFTQSYACHEVCPNPLSLGQARVYPSGQRRSFYPTVLGTPVEQQQQYQPVQTAPTHTMQPIRVYVHRFSQPSRSVVWYAKYARKNVVIQEIDLFAEEHKTASFVQRFPAGQVPTADDNGYYIEEASAILQHLARGDAIVPTDAAGVARVNALLAKHHGAARLATTKIISPLLFGPKNGRAKLIREGIETATPALQYYDKVLAATPYLAGHKISLADFLFAPEVDQLRFCRDAIGVDALAAYPSIRAYLRRLEAVPGYTENVIAAEAFAIEMKLTVKAEEETKQEEKPKKASRFFKGLTPAPRATRPSRFFKNLEVSV